MVDLTACPERPKVGDVVEVVPEPPLRGHQHGGRDLRRARRHGRGGVAGGRARAGALIRHGRGRDASQAVPGACLRRCEALVRPAYAGLFSLSGNQILLDLRRHHRPRPLPIVHTRHEAAWRCHMADAWGRLTETPGVAPGAPPGPGHLNAAVRALRGADGGVAAWSLLSGHAPRGQRGRGAFQEMDQVGAAAPGDQGGVAGVRGRRAHGRGDGAARSRSPRARPAPGPVHREPARRPLEGDGRRRSPLSGAVHRRGWLAAAASDAALAQILGLLADARRPLIVLGPAMARLTTRRRGGGGSRGRPAFAALPVESPRGLNDPWLRLAANASRRRTSVLLLGEAARLRHPVRRSGRPLAGRRIIQIDWEASARE